MSKTNEFKRITLRDGYHDSWHTLYNNHIQYFYHDHYWIYDKGGRPVWLNVAYVTDKYVFHCYTSKSIKQIKKDLKQILLPELSNIVIDYLQGASENVSL